MAVYYFRYLKIILFFIFLTVVAIIISIYFYLQANQKQTVAYHVYYVVGDHVGFNLTDDSINFGTTFPGSNVRREVQISSDKKDVLIDVYIEDVDYVYPDKNHFILEKGKNTKITFILDLPQNATKGSYNGRIVMILRDLASS